MALSSESLSNLIVALYKAKMREAFPDVVKGGRVVQVPKEDGTFEYQSIEQRGPIEIDEKGIRPLAEAIAEALVDHLKTSGVVTDTAAGANWRIT